MEIWGGLIMSPACKVGTIPNVSRPWRQTTCFALNPSPLLGVWTCPVPGRVRLLTSLVSTLGTESARASLVHRTSRVLAQSVAGGTERVLRGSPARMLRSVCWASPGIYSMYLFPSLVLLCLMVP